MEAFFCQAGLVAIGALVCFFVGYGLWLRSTAPHFEAWYQQTRYESMHSLNGTLDGVLGLLFVVIVILILAELDLWHSVDREALRQLEPFMWIPAALFVITGLLRLSRH